MSNPTVTTLYIARHGESEWNVIRRIQGQSDTKLTENGKKQAEKLSSELRGISFDAIYSSDLKRAKDTARVIALEKKLALRASVALRERHRGKLEGRYVAELQEELRNLYLRFDELSEEERKSHDDIASVETAEESMGRYITYLREVALAHPGKNVLIVSHGNIIRTFLAHLGHREYLSGSIENTGYVVLTCDGVDFFLKKLVGVKKGVVN